MSTTERKLDFRDKRRETEQIKSAHEKRRPGAQPSLLFCPSWAETTYFAGQTTKVQPIERCAFNNAAKPNRPLGAIVAGKSNQLRNTFNNAAKPSRSHDAIDNATKPNQTHRATGAALKPNSPRGTIGHTVHAAPPATQSTRRRRPNSTRGTAGHTARTAPPATRPGTARASSYR